VFASRERDTRDMTVEDLAMKVHVLEYNLITVWDGSPGYGIGIGAYGALFC
jgi:hypothetical protein